MNFNSATKRSVNPVILTVLSVLLISCAGPVGEQTNAPIQVTAPDPGQNNLDNLLNLARISPSPESEKYLLQAASLLLEANNVSQAQVLIQRIRQVDRLPVQIQANFALLNARIALDSEQVQIALRWLNGNLLNNLSALDTDLQIKIRTLRSISHQQNGEAFAAARELIQLTAQLTGNEIIRNNDRIWLLLSGTSIRELENLASDVQSYEFRGWTELARAINSNQDNIQQQLSELENWRTKWRQHSAAIQLPESLSSFYELWNNRASHIAVLLPLQTPAGRAIIQGFLGAHYHSLQQSSDLPKISFYDSSANLDIVTLYQKAIGEGADLIIGPLDKVRVNLLLTMLLELDTIPAPTLILNYSDLFDNNSGLHPPDNLYQFGLSPTVEVAHAIKLAWAKGYRNAAILTPRRAEDRATPVPEDFASQWRLLGGKIVAQESFSGDGDFSDVIVKFLDIDDSESRKDQLISLLPTRKKPMVFQPRRRQDIDFIFLMANPVEGRQVNPTLDFYFAGDIPVYAMPDIYDGRQNQNVDRELNGIIFIDSPWVLSDEESLKLQMQEIWPQVSGRFQRLQAMGVDAYRLFPRLKQLENQPETRLFGATGILSMSPQRAINRIPSSARFIEGTATLPTSP